MNTADEYRQQDVLTAGPGRLLIMMYDACIRNIRNAGRYISGNQPSDAHSALLKAQDIILQLISNLDMQYRISANLISIYRFIYNELISVNIKKDASLLPPLVNLLSGLREAWTQAVAIDRRNSYETGRSIAL